MKVQLCKLVSPHPLCYSGLETILTDIETTHNSRPLAALNSTEPNSNLALTPGHFLIDRPLKAPPTKPASTTNFPTYDASH